MDPQKKKLIIVAYVLLLVLAFGYYQYKGAYEIAEPVSGTSADGTAGTVSGDQPSADKTDAAADKSVEIDRTRIRAVLTKDPFIYDFTNLRDPMIPVIYADDSDETKTGDEAIAVSHAHNLDGIVWDPYKPLASIDNTVVGIGETLEDGSVITNIFPNKVILKSDSGTFSVGFYEE